MLELVYSVVMMRTPDLISSQRLARRWRRASSPAALARRPRPPRRPRARVRPPPSPPRRPRRRTFAEETPCASRCWGRCWGRRTRARRISRRTSSTNPIAPWISSTRCVSTTFPRGGRRSRAASRSSWTKPAKATQSAAYSTRWTTTFPIRSLKARSIHWSPYDPVRVVNADP